HRVLPVQEGRQLVGEVGVLRQPLAGVQRLASVFGLEVLGQGFFEPLVLVVRGNRGHGSLTGSWASAREGCPTPPTALPPPSARSVHPSSFPICSRDQRGTRR